MEDRSARLFYAAYKVVLAKCVYGGGGGGGGLSECTSHCCALQNVVLVKCVAGELNEYASFMRITECSFNRMCLWS